MFSPTFFPSIGSFICKSVHQEPVDEEQMKDGQMLMGEGEQKCEG